MGKRTERTQANKDRRMIRDQALKLRPDSELCAYALDMRHRRQRNNTPEKRRAATERGQKQFISPEV